MTRMSDGSAVQSGEVRRIDNRSGGGTPRRSESKTDYGRLTQVLREEILSGRYQDGDRLKVSEIAERFSTSTNPAREALQALEGEGLVTIAPNRGASVRVLTEDLVHNVFDIRLLLEPYIVRGFVEYGTTADITKIVELHEGCETAATDDSHPAYHRHNTALHDYIIDRHFNEEAIGIMRRHNGWMRVLSRRNPMSQAEMRRACEEHRALIAALRERDVDAAVRATETHLFNSRQRFIEKMRRDRMNDARRTRIGAA